MSVERTSARRRWGAGAVAVALACLGPLAARAVTPAGAAGERPPTVTVEGRSAVREVHGHFDVPVPLPVAWSVLTDYDHIADFVGSMRASAVESRGDGELTVRQEAVAGVFPFRRVARLLLRVREHPEHRIEFHDLLERDFHVYRGEWELLPGPAGTVVNYRLRAQPAGGVPLGLDRPVLSRAARRLLTEVRAEMMRRAEVAGGL